MRFFGGPDNPYRILTAMRPHPICDRQYLKAVWRSKHNPNSRRRLLLARSKTPKNQRGGWWNKLRISGLRPMRRVINPAVRYERVTRQCNEIRARKYKQRPYWTPYLWARRNPIRKGGREA